MATCPDCHNALDVRLFNGIELDVCPQGHGVWFDPSELVAVMDSDTLAQIDAAFPGVASDVAPVVEQLEATVRKHPKTGAPLTRYEWNPGSGVVIDAAEDGGMWLDAGELERYAEKIKGFQSVKPVIPTQLQETLDAIALDVDQREDDAFRKAGLAAVPFAPLLAPLIAPLLNVYLKFR